MWADVYVYAAHYFEEVQRICDRDVIGEVTAHGSTANGTIRGTAP